jgi:glycerol-3-phosphate dehydrogenase (NAD(P)+)
MHMVAEGVKTARTTHVLAERFGLELPICDSVYRVVNDEIRGTDAYAGLLSTQAGHEAEPG